MPASTERAQVTLARRLVPPACLSLAALLHLSRVPVLEWLLVTPAIDMVALYYWTLARPNRMPIWVLFVLGLIVDSFSTTVLGIHAILYIMGYALARLIRRHMEAPSLLPMWGIFAVWLMVQLLAEWLMHGWQHEALPPFRAMPLQWVITLCIYPLIHLFFDRVLTIGQRWRI